MPWISLTALVISGIDLFSDAKTLGDQWSRAKGMTNGEGSTFYA